MQTDTPITPPLRTNDLVALFGIPEPTWRGWRYEGKGPRWYKLGSIVMYDKEDVQAWVEEQKASTGKDTA
jgi:predicted DNA-binding transcriptional regulator AlpA